ncbi:MAG: DUF4136 domain-containing protein [bacterium]|nr:DUF4136 domain-containing protein [bacterium]
MQSSRSNRRIPHRRLRIRGLLAVGLIASALVGCQTFDVRSDWDETVRFDAMKRFYFEEPPLVEGANPFADNSILRKRVRSSIVAVLEERGFGAVDSRDRADFVVTYVVMLEDELRVDGVTMGTGVGGWRRPYGYGAVGTTTSRIDANQEATLIIDFQVPESGELAWRGWGSRMLSTRDRNRSDERLEAGVRAILQRFPPGGGDD